MVNVGSTTAVLFFSRNETHESKQKSFGTNRTLGHRISTRLIRRTRRLLSNQPFAVFEIGSLDGPVSEGFVNAIESIWSKGFDRIISVGNDCPQLKVSDIVRADELLNSNSLVAGPDHRGGVYLLGINKTDFDRNIFLNLPWHTNRFLDFLKNHICQIGYLQPLHDINDIREVRLISTCRKNLVRFLVELIAPINSNFQHTESTIAFELPLAFLRRGPPLA